MRKIFVKLMRCPLFFLPEYLIQILKFETLAYFGSMFSKSLKFKSGEKIFINLGSGSSAIKGFINIDFFNVKNIDYSADIRKPLKIDSGVVSGILCEHTIEHLTYTQAQHILNECYRVLKPNGVIRIILPDLSIFIENYSAKNERWFKGWESLMFINSEDEIRSRRRLSSPMEAISFVTQEYGHLSAWDEETIAIYLRRAGFSKIMPTKYRVGQVDALLVDLDAEDRRYVSLYVEAMK